SRRLARARGGDLVLLRSDAVNGSSFALTIDAGPIDGVRLIDRLDLRPQPEQLPLETSLESSRLDGMHILVVEDLPDNQLLISRFLRMAGATVDLAGNGWEALKKTAGPDDTYDLILMDIQMPEMDGYQATRKLRERGYDRPILALTAHALKEEREKSLAAGCDDHLTKPIDRELLIDRVALYHGRKHVFPPKMAGGSPAVLH
ncbi:MAG TPA: response regulator, partial [Bdellovibrionales bacterium]|nr:response regulator [Bdellovibrionales bacterium]